MKRCLVFLLLLLCGTASAFQIVDVSVSGVKKVFLLEAAVTPDQKTTGLMHRAAIENSDGMVFIYRPSEIVKMWMKNTLIPLDMIFADAGGHVLFIRENAAPMSMERIGPDTPVSYIIELNAGDAEKYRIRVGDTITVGY